MLAVIIKEIIIKTFLEHLILQGTVPVESEGRDGLFMPILVICAFTITALFTVLAVHQVKQRQRNRRAAAIPELAEQIEGKPSTLYQVPLVFIH